MVEFWRSGFQHCESGSKGEFSHRDRGLTRAFVCRQRIRLRYVPSSWLMFTGERKLGTAWPPFFPRVVTAVLHPLLQQILAEGHRCAGPNAAAGVAYRLVAHPSPVPAGEAELPVDVLAALYVAMRDCWYRDIRAPPFGDTEFDDPYIRRTANQHRPLRQARPVEATAAFRNEDDEKGNETHATGNSRLRSRHECGLLAASTAI